MMEPQSTWVIPVLDELVLMNLPPCWRSGPGGGGGGELKPYGKVFQLNFIGSPAFCTYYGDCGKHFEIMKGN